MNAIASQVLCNAWAQRVNLRQAGWPKMWSWSHGGNAGEGLLQWERVSSHGVSSHDRALDISTLLKPYAGVLPSYSCAQPPCSEVP